MASKTQKKAAPAATAAVLKDANAGGFSGYWVADKSRSDSPRNHLAVLGLPELAIGAAEKLNIALHIVHSGRDFSVAHLSELGHKERKFTVGEEYREPSRDGGTIRFMVESISPTEMAIAVQMGNCKLTERKVLHGSDMLVQTVTMAVKGQSGSSTTTRVFTRQGSHPPAAPLGLDPVLLGMPGAV